MKNKKDKEYKKYRDKGKPVTLGAPGGLGADTMGLQFIQAGIRLKYEVLCTTKSEYAAKSLVRKYKSETPNIRVKRTGFREWSVVYDEIVGLKKMLYDLYPELQLFLTSGHEKFMTGEFKWVKGEFAEWEKEELYRYTSYGVSRDFCSYTSMVNGFLMQTPSACGAKNVTYELVKTFADSTDVYILGMIHDEFLAEVRDDDNLYSNIEKISEIMIDGMQKVLKLPRVAVEASIMTYWSKSVTEWDKVYFKNANDSKLRSV